MHLRFTFVGLSDVVIARAASLTQLHHDGWRDLAVHRAEFRNTVRRRVFASV
jgi:hypothetical protein